MFKNHPKGLFVLALANMGERFGYYTMMAIFVLYLQAKFGYTSDSASSVYSFFMAGVYFLPLLGGLIADKWLGYGKTVLLGIFVMFGGYLLLAVPSGTDAGDKLVMFGALGLIALGTGFFKGNLQALVGNMYDDPRYSAKRDLAFSIFYMCINIGAFFAPSAAGAVSNYFMGKDGYVYDAEIPALANQFLTGTISSDDAVILTGLQEAQGMAGTDTAAFCTDYIGSLGTSYNYGFGLACISLVISLLIFTGFRKWYKAADKTEKQKAEEAEAAGREPIKELTPEQTRERLMALGLVFAVVIFFWMSFHQNGLTMTFFARDYTVSDISGFGRFGFSLLTLLPFVMAFYGIINLFQSKCAKGKAAAGAAAVAGAVLSYWAYTTLPDTMKITPQIFQQFNPYFIVILTPVTVWLFIRLAKKDREPLAPRKIGIGMLIAALGFVVLMAGSMGLPSPASMGEKVSPVLVSQNWLIGTYFVLTISELFLSPMGISFVSKVAPPKYKGLMQGGWFAATAIGNYLTGVIGWLWKAVELWMLWGILVCCCLLSAAFIFSVMKRLEKTTADA